MFAQKAPKNGNQFYIGWMIRPESASAGERGVAKDASRTLRTGGILRTVLPEKVYIEEDIMSYCVDIGTKALRIE